MPPDASPERRIDKITALRYVQGGCPLPEPGFWPTWWPHQPIRARLWLKPPQIVDGLIQIPQGPGWSMELNWEYVEAHARVDQRIEG